jgi:hypothetical protein
MKTITSPRCAPGATCSGSTRDASAPWAAQTRSAGSSGVGGTPVWSWKGASDGRHERLNAASRKPQLSEATSSTPAELERGEQEAKARGHATRRSRGQRAALRGFREGDGVTTRCSPVCRAGLVRRCCIAAQLDDLLRRLECHICPRQASHHAHRVLAQAQRSGRALDEGAVTGCDQSIAAATRPRRARLDAPARG